MDELYCDLYTILRACFSDIHNTFYSPATLLGNGFPSALYISLDYRQKYGLSIYENIKSYYDVVP